MAANTKLLDTFVRGEAIRGVGGKATTGNLDFFKLAEGLASITAGAATVISLVGSCAITTGAGGTLHQVQGLSGSAAITTATTGTLTNNAAVHNANTKLLQYYTRQEANPYIGGKTNSSTLDFFRRAVGFNAIVYPIASGGTPIALSGSSSIRTATAATLSVANVLHLTSSSAIRFGCSGILTVSSTTAIATPVSRGFGMRSQIITNGLCAPNGVGILLSGSASIVTACGASLRQVVPLRGTSAIRTVAGANLSQTIALRGTSAIRTVGSGILLAGVPGLLSGSMAIQTVCRAIISIGALQIMPHPDYLLAFNEDDVYIPDDNVPLKWTLTRKDGADVEMPIDAAVFVWDAQKDLLDTLAPSLETNGAAPSQILAALWSVRPYGTYTAQLTVTLPTDGQIRSDRVLLIVK